MDRRGRRQRPPPDVCRASLADHPRHCGTGRRAPTGASQGQRSALVSARGAAGAALILNTEQFGNTTLMHANAPVR